MNKPVKLSDIIDAIEIMTDESSSYLNMKTGEVVMVTDEEMSVISHRLAQFSMQLFNQYLCVLKYQIYNIQ